MLKFIAVVMMAYFCSFQVVEAGGIGDVFNSPDEVSFIGASFHGKDKDGYIFNGIHPGIGISGLIRGSETWRWQAGFVTKDSYECKMVYGGASWFPFASGRRDEPFLFGISVLAASKCLSPDERRFVVFPLPTVRLFPYRSLGVEAVFSPKLRGDKVWFVALQLRHEY